MAYEKQTFDLDTKLAHMEDGIAAAQEAADGALHAEDLGGYAKTADVLPNQVGDYAVSGVIVVPKGSPLVSGTEYNGMVVVEADLVQATRTHHLDGVIGQSSSAAADGFDSLYGTAPVYVDGVSGTAIRFPGSGIIYYKDNLASQYTEFWLRIPTTLSSSACVARAIKGSGTSGTLVLNTDGSLSLWTGLSAVAATSSTKLAQSEWVKVGMQCGADGLGLKIYSTGETLSAAPVATPDGWMWGTAWSANNGGPFDIDEIRLGDQWLS